MLLFTLMQFCGTGKGKQRAQLQLRHFPTFPFPANLWKYAGHSTPLVICYGRMAYKLVLLHLLQERSCPSCIYYFVESMLWAIKNIVMLPCCVNSQMALLGKPITFVQVHFPFLSLLVFVYPRRNQERPFSSFQEILVSLVCVSMDLLQNLLHGSEEMKYIMCDYEDFLQLFPSYFQ